MEEQQTQTTRKRRRYDWWKKHAPKEGKAAKKSEKPPKKIKKKKSPNPVKQETTTGESLENDDKKKRYILFVGNLPFSVNEWQVKNHFKCTGNIKQFRLMTKKTGESKGCGFMEFDDFPSYHKALNLHYSVLAGRKIRVQITCGGGGKGENREKKLQERITKFRRGRKTKSKLRKAKSKQNDNSLSDISTDKMQMSEDPQDDTQVNINN